MIWAQKIPFLVTPDPNYLPKKYHQFLLPPIRRVYPNMTLHNELRNQISVLNARLLVTKLERDEFRREYHDLEDDYCALRVKYEKLKHR